MSREEELHATIQELIDEGSKPSAAHLARHLDWPLQDIHRCLNILERKDRVFTYKKNAFGRDMRLAGIKRE